MSRLHWYNFQMQEYKIKNKGKTSNDLELGLTQSLWLLQLLISVTYFGWSCKEPFQLEASSAL
jgi:hypothetical protein